MLILDVIEHETIWGGYRLTGNPEKKIGHLYSLITEGQMANKIINGRYAGQTFRDYFKENKAELGMAEYGDFPFVIALVDASGDLSIQVHPDDTQAQALENRRYGKNESWYFIEPPITGRIYNGCVCKDKAELKKRIDDGRLAGLADTLRVIPGDYVYVKAGTLHAMTAGTLVYEIEENCNLTYRFYDYDRRGEDGNPRELHTEKAFYCIDINKKSAAIKHPGYVEERRYSTELLRNITEYKNMRGSIACFTLIDGGFVSEGIEIRPGMSIVVLPGEGFKCNVQTAIAARPVTAKKEAV